jgi:NAD-dependent dihydropyrimidine dehydrogenase PreA subunit
MGGLAYLKDVVTLELDPDKCVGCGMCLLVCPHEVFWVSDGKAQIRNRDNCMECGACMKNCPVEALNVQVGVGCAAAVINAALGREGSSCCCVVEDIKDIKESDFPMVSNKSSKSGCC